MKNGEPKRLLGYVLLQDGLSDSKRRNRFRELDPRFRPNKTLYDAWYSSYNHIRAIEKIYFGWNFTISNHNHDVLAALVNPAIKQLPEGDFTKDSYSLLEQKIRPRINEIVERSDLPALALLMEPNLRQQLIHWGFRSYYSLSHPEGHPELEELTAHHLP